MCFADFKRPREMVLYDPATAAAGASQQRANKRARQNATTAKSSSSSSSSSTLSSAEASGAMVPYAGTTTTILDVAPINTAPPLLLRPPPVAAAAGREEPPCLRRHFLAALGLRADLPVHFIGDKCMTSTDLNPQQNRFRIPSDGVERHLRSILSPQELDAANLLVVKGEDEDPCPAATKKRPRQEEKQQQPAGPPVPPQNGAAAAAAEKGQGQLPPSGNEKIKKPKKKGKVHGGLRVKLVHLHAGAVELLMARWDSSKGTVIKGEGYVQFLRRCGFREGDKVEIWAFVQHRFRLFGKDIFGDSLLHILVVNKQEEPRCCLCRDGEE